MNLIYTTIGFSEKYAECVIYFLQSIEHFTIQIDFDILIICDLNMHKNVGEMIEKNVGKHILEKISFLLCPQSIHPMMASVQKLSIFDYQIIHQYKNVLYIDLDVLCLKNINELFNEFDIYYENIQYPQKNELLYVSKESNKTEDHILKWWSMEDYTHNDLEFFKNKQIYPFNAGIFAFKTTHSMKTHFQNVWEMIKESIKNNKLYFYEQAYMNVYFNRRNLICSQFFNIDNYVLSPTKDVLYQNKIIHFCGSPGNANYKNEIMKDYIQRHALFSMEKANNFTNIYNKKNNNENRVKKNSKHLL